MSRPGVGALVFNVERGARFVLGPVAGALMAEPSLLPRDNPDVHAAYLGE